MFKKKYTIFALLAVFLLVVSGCTANSSKNTNNKKDNEPISSSTDVGVDIEEDKLTTYTNDELGFSFKTIKNIEVVEENENKRFDTGKRKSFRLINKGRFLASIDFTSSDYAEGVGEGGCTYYSGYSININESYDELLSKVQCFNPKELKKIKIDNKDAIRFYSKTEYANQWINEMMILPFNKNGYTNIVINGPVLKEMDRGSDYEVATLNLDSQENILFENIIKSLKFY